MLVALVPPTAVTVTSAVPATFAGDVAVIDVEESTLSSLAGIPPKRTALAPVKPVPVIVTTVPPVAGPPFAESFVTVGGGR